MLALSQLISDSLQIELYERNWSGNIFGAFGSCVSSYVNGVGCAPHICTVSIWITPSANTDTCLCLDDCWKKANVNCCYLNWASTVSNLHGLARLYSFYLDRLTVCKLWHLLSKTSQIQASHVGKCNKEYVWCLVKKSIKLHSLYLDQSTRSANMLLESRHKRHKLENVTQNVFGSNNNDMVFWKYYKPKAQHIVHGIKVKKSTEL